MAWNRQNPSLIEFVDSDTGSTLKVALVGTGPQYDVTLYNAAGTSQGVVRVPDLAFLDGLFQDVSDQIV